MGAHIDPAVVARAKQNFHMRHARNGRVWDAADAARDGSELSLTDAERAEFLAQAQYEIDMARPGRAGRKSGAALRPD
jgi:hypothetical protein